MKSIDKMEAWCKGSERSHLQAGMDRYADAMRDAAAKAHSLSIEEASLKPTTDKGLTEAYFRELVFTALGHASVCWSELPSGVFDSSKVKEIGDKLVNEILSRHEPSTLKHPCNGCKDLKTCKAAKTGGFSSTGNNPCFIPEAVEVINGLKRGECWCEKGIGNPMMKSHSSACLKASQYLSGIPNTKREDKK